MQSTKLFFNRTIFAKTAKRYWPLWTMYLLVWVIALGGITRSCVAVYSVYAFDYRDLLDLTWRLGTISGIVTACVSAMFVHSWMYNSRSTSGYSCLPICRGRLFTAVTLAGIVPIIICNLIACIVAFIVALVLGYFILLAVLQSFVILTLQYIFFYGLATLCASLTGHVFVLPAVYAIFNFVVVVVELLVKTLLTTFTFGATYDSMKLDFLSPAVFMYEHTNEIVDEVTAFATLNNWWAYIIYAIVGIVFAVCGMLIFRKRKMESASDVVAVNILKPVFKYCLCFGCALVLGLLLFTIIFEAFFVRNSPAASIVICVCMLVGSFIGYFAAEMLMRKSFKVFRRSWRGFLVSAAVIVLFITAMEADFFGFERNIPDNDDVNSVSIRVWGEPTVFTEEADINQITLLHERIINNKSQTEKNLYNYYKEQRYSYSETSSYPFNVEIVYTKDNGKTFSRNYIIMYSEVDKFCSDMLTFLNRPECIVSRMERAITPEYISRGSIYYNYTVLAENAEKGDTKPAYDAPASYAITQPIPVNTTVSSDGELDYIHGNFELTSVQARDLFLNAILLDARAGNIGRIRPSYPGYSDKLYIYIEMSSQIPEYHGSELVNYTHEYIHIEDITSDAVHTVAALKELGIDLEAIASSAIK